MNNSDEMNFDVTKTTPLVCSECGNHTFVQSFFLRELSALVSPTGKAGIVPVPTFACGGCGAVPGKVLPPFIRNEAMAAKGEVSQEPVKPSLTLV
jgi:hypothetical protein